MSRRTGPQKSDTSPGTLQDIVDSVEDSMVVIDCDYRIRLVNAAACRKLAPGGEPPEGQFCYRVLHNRKEPCRAPLWDCSLREVVKTGRAFSTVHPPSAEGEETYLKVTAYPLHDKEGNVRAVVELRRDVTAERELEAQVLRRHQHLVSLNQISSAASGNLDLNGVLKVALDNITPDDVFFGRKEDIFAERQETRRITIRSRKVYNPMLREVRTHSLNG